MTRATFDLRMTGEPSSTEQAANALAELLTEVGYFYEEDFEALYGEAWAITGLRLHTAGAVRVALDLIARVGAYMIETEQDERVDLVLDTTADQVDGIRFRRQ